MVVGAGDVLLEGQAISEHFWELIPGK